jgi:hypothetical protein
VRKACSILIALRNTVGGTLPDIVSYVEQGGERALPPELSATSISSERYLLDLERPRVKVVLLWRIPAGRDRSLSAQAKVNGHTVTSLTISPGRAASFEFVPARYGLHVVSLETSQGWGVQRTIDVQGSMLIEFQFLDRDSVAVSAEYAEKF